jgi:hypothetical protein
MASDTIQNQAACCQTQAGMQLKSALKVSASQGPLSRAEITKPGRPKGWLLRALLVHNGSVQHH